MKAWWCVLMVWLKTAAKWRTIPGLELPDSHIESIDTLSCSHKPAQTLFIQVLYPPLQFFGCCQGDVLQSLTHSPLSYLFPFTLPCHTLYCFQGQGLIKFNVASSLLLIVIERELGPSCWTVWGISLCTRQSWLYTVPMWDQTHKQSAQNQLCIDVVTLAFSDFWMLNGPALCLCLGVFVCVFCPDR